MKKLYLLLLVPLLMATQCDDDDGLVNYITDYRIQNDSSVDLILLTENGQEILIEKETSYIFSDAGNPNEIPVTPSENSDLNSIKLYKLDTNDTLVLAYVQEPILDDLWSVSDSEIYSFDYTLIITDDLIN